jgi:4a-hydroxytetrahydrobiopterin dehydratase
MKWNIQEGKLINNFTFKSQTELAEFLLKVAQYADSIHHHPNYRVFECSKVEFTLFTNDANQITSLDEKLAAYISTLI